VARAPNWKRKLSFENAQASLRSDFDLAVKKGHDILFLPATDTKAGSQYLWKNLFKNHAKSKLAIF